MPDRSTPRARHRSKIWEYVFFGFAVMFLGASYHTRRQDTRRISALAFTRDSLLVHAQALQGDVSRYRHASRHSRLVAEVSLSGRTLSGGSMTIRPGAIQRPLVLYTYDPSCVACARGLPALERLFAAVQCPVDVIGVFTGSDEEADSIRATGRPSFPILRDASGSAWDALQLQDPSVLALFAPPGRLVGLWSGELTDDEHTQVLAGMTAACGDPAAEPI